MDQHAIAKCQIASGRNCDTAVARFVIVKIVFAEWIGRVQPIAARMPEGRMLRIGWMIKNHYPHAPPLQLSGIIHPTRAFAPDVFRALQPFGIGERRSAFLFELIGETKAEQSLFGIAEFQGRAVIGADRGLRVNDVVSVKPVKNEEQSYRPQDFFVWRDKIEFGDKRPLFLSTLSFRS